ncbi:hypothetical protein niasHT_004735 [Heterodera trifolii]|uniref:Calcium-transporting ATPase n=1 Tax=Heterodera trifolii TaxID=157864 RepID=A0ABD2M9H6_9BILA
MVTKMKRMTDRHLGGRKWERWNEKVIGSRSDEGGAKVVKLIDTAIMRSTKKAEGGAFDIFPFFAILSHSFRRSPKIQSAPIGQILKRKKRTERQTPNNNKAMVVSGPPQSPRTGLALTDLQQSASSSSSDSSNSGNGSSNGGSCSGSIGGGVISGLAIAGHGGSSNWSTRGVGGIGAGLSCSSVGGGGLFGGTVGMKMGGGLDGLHSGGPSSLGQGPFGGFPSSSGNSGGEVRATSFAGPSEEWLSLRSFVALFLLACLFSSPFLSPPFIHCQNLPNSLPLSLSFILFHSTEKFILFNCVASSPPPVPLAIHSQNEKPKRKEQKMDEGTTENNNNRKSGAKKRKQKQKQQAVVAEVTEPHNKQSEETEEAEKSKNGDSDKDGKKVNEASKPIPCQSISHQKDSTVNNTKNNNRCCAFFGFTGGTGFLRSLFRTDLGEGAHLLVGQNSKARCAAGSNGTTMIPAMDIQEASSRGAEECVSRLRTDPTNGLSSAEASRRLGFSGFNEFELNEKVSLFGKYLEQFKNPLICLLLASTIVSVLMKQFDDALSIAVAVLITLEKLNRLVPPTAHCIRNGRSVTFYARELVPGDLVLLNAGDRVPADIRVIETVQLQLDESSFTGENEARQKVAAALPENAAKLSTNNGTINGNGGGSIEHMDNIAFMGTLVCAGRGKGIVIGTGPNSKFGEVFMMMQSEESPKTPLQNSMDQLGKQLSLYSFGVIGLIFLLGLIQGRDMLEMFTIGVSLAVAAIPEGLPIVVAVTLAIGVMRMSSRNAVVKKLSAVETLGCVTVICSDKTGTLTKNEMTACIVVAADDTRAEVNAKGFMHLFAFTLTYFRFLSSVSTIRHFRPPMEVAESVACRTLANGTIIGQPTEGALLVLATETQLDISRSYFRRLNEMPFSSDNKWMGVQVEPINRSGEVELMLKGAIDRVLGMCVGYLDNGVAQRPLDAQRREHILHLATGLGQSGLRVIAMACGKDMNSLHYAGLVGIMDPPRPGCRQSIETVQNAGVSVKMVTGDALETAISIGTRLNIFNSGDNTLSGAQIDELTDMDLERLIRGVSIFYRSSPRHKLRIVKALQNIGEVVAMTGDGVNDAVALKKSDIGVAMGNGTDVSKEAADMVLINDDFSTIKAAIEEGKGIYHNITNFVKFQLSTSVSAISLIAISTLFHFENPLNAMQILWINIIMDGPPAQSLGVERVDADIIRQPPRNVREPLVNRSLIISVVTSAAIIIAGTLFVFYKEMAADNEITPRDTTMTFTCFVLFDMWNALSCRSSRKMIWEIGLFSNRMFCLSVFGSLLCQCLVIYFRPLQRIFQTEALTIKDLAFLSLLTSSVFVFNEGRKYFHLRRQRIKQQFQGDDAQFASIDSQKFKRANGGSR